jgi:hypothetical protein
MKGNVLEVRNGKHIRKDKWEEINVVEAGKYEYDDSTKKNGVGKKDMEKNLRIIKYQKFHERLISKIKIAKGRLQ